MIQCTRENIAVGDIVYLGEIEQFNYEIRYIFENKFAMVVRSVDANGDGGFEEGIEPISYFYKMG